MTDKISDAEVEAAARCYDGAPESTFRLNEDFKQRFRAALEAAVRVRHEQQAAVPAGGEWKMVPVEPVSEMCAAGFRVLRDSEEPSASKRISKLYCAMLAASPPSPASQAAVPGMTEEALARVLAELRHDEVFGVPLDEKANLSRLYWVESQWRGFKHAAAFIIDRLANAQPDNRVAELEATIDDAASGITELRRQLREAKASLAEARKVIEPFCAAVLTLTGDAVGLERNHFDAARDWLARNKEP